MKIMVYISPSQHYNSRRTSAARGAGIERPSPSLSPQRYKLKEILMKKMEMQEDDERQNQQIE